MYIPGATILRHDPVQRVILEPSREGAQDIERMGVAQVRPT